MLKLTLLTASAFAALISATASAQTAPASDDRDTQPTLPIIIDDPRVGDIVVVASGVEQAPETVGQAVTVIDRATIERRQTVALSDLLATTPGVTVTRNGGLGAFTAVRIRGAEGEQTLTLIDGVRVNDPSSPGGGFDFANLLAGSIDRVEVLRGPNSVPWGSQAIGGVVNVVTAQPTDRLSARGNVEYGSFNSAFANAGVSGTSGIVSGALNAGYLKTDGISAAASGTEPDGYRQYGATGRIGVALADNVSLDLRGYYADSRVDLDGFPPPSYALADTSDYAKTRELYGYAGLNATFADGRFHNRVAVTVADIHRDNFASPAAAAPSFFGRGRSERYTYQGDVRVVDAVRLVAGAEHEDTHYFDGTLRTSRGVTSFYGEAIVTPVADLTLSGGVRHDQDSAYGGHTTFGANAAYTLPTRTTLRGSYAEGFKAPTLYQLGAAFYGNPNLRPETARSWDAGIEQHLLGRAVTASATWFHRDTTNQIDFDLATFTYANIARTRTQGLEFGLDLRPSDRLTLNASYSFIDAINRAPGANFGKQLARRPRQSVSTSIDWRTPLGLSLGATVLAVGDSFDDAGNASRLDGYVVAGVRAELPIGERLALYGRVDNLFDARYQVVRGYGTPGRAAYGGVRVRFD
ncbi:MAG: TonB-dependent receptor [Sphingomonas sp.]|uniref:TonB-dependent receptor plug domain-containing protein n=1 Tax=Sphingomonas sp. TaxID=28214 RepID=UPI001AD3EF96|nr:TonB-dependent receptor [Sphingomonas sp.]MBN8808701.1 TonB-dependent receptor [Sphingomonas sp.]